MPEQTVKRVAVVGGGIGGLAVALFLGRRGHQVVVFEQDGLRPTGDLDHDFFRWPRPRTPQAVQPHAFLSPIRSVLRSEASDVYATALELGAWEQHEFDWFADHPAPRPGDDDLVTVRARRIVLETALSDAVWREPRIEMRLSEPVEGLAFDQDGDVPRVVGVRSASGVLEADLVIDAAGRRSPVGAWLTAAGCRDAVVENHHIGIAYFSRWYRLPTGGPANPGRVRDVAVTPFAINLVFPSDNLTFAVTFAVPVGDPTRLALRDPAVFDAVARRFPASGPWLGLEPESLGDVHVMAGLDNRWTALVDGAGPVVTGLVGVGDSVTHTNPTLGQGAALALLAAQRLAATAHWEDPAALAVDYYRWATRTLKPWFDHQVTVDRRDEAFLDGHTGSGAARPMDDVARAGLARLACSLDEPVVMRARAQVRHLVLPPDQAYGDEEVRACVAGWLDRHPGFPGTGAGPTRAEWEALTGAAAPVPALHR